jgi:DUF1680 family protein
MQPIKFPHLNALPLTKVNVTGGFWASRLETNRRVTMNALFNELEKAGNIANCELAARGARDNYHGPLYMDSDLFKAMEAAAYTLAAHPKDAIQRRLDPVIETLERVQQPDGYLNTYFQVVKPDKRWTNLRDAHELYCAGHLFEAAVAHYEATGSKKLLNIATRYADYIGSVFGEGHGKRIGYCGHPEIELALVKLAQATGERKYFSLAQFFVDKRGSKVFAAEHGTNLDQYDGTTWQDDRPIREYNEIVGHAVRAAYLFSGATDLVAETGEKSLLNAILRVWHNTATKRMYITGGIGNSSRNEGFTTDYDLPNASAYQETCASIAFVFWSHRLNLLLGDGQFADAVERALYNGVLAGLSLSGDRFFYVNPLESKGAHHRQAWHYCACCPPNIGRLLASLPAYLYAGADGDQPGIWIHHYAHSQAQTDINGTRVGLQVKTDYPWEGKVEVMLDLKSPAAFELRLRVPGWCRGASLTVNGKSVRNVREEKGYFVIERTWRKGDSIELNLPMPIMKIDSHPNVEANRGRIALQRGPIVYCIEGCDQPVPVESVSLPLSARLTTKWKPRLLGGVMTLEGTGSASVAWKGNTLYREAKAPRPVPIRAIPYYAWDNREPCPMSVWLIAR